MTWFADSDNQTAAMAAHAEGATFVSLDLPSGFLRLHTRTGTINWGGYDWLGVGKFGGIETVKEDAELRPNTVTLQLSGVDAALVSAAMAEDYHGRAVRVYYGLFDTTTFALIGDPETVFVGLMDYMQVTLGANTGAITVHCESELARWQRPRALLYTHESQQLLYPGDRFFDMVPVLQSRTIDWGKKGKWGKESGYQQVNRYTGRLP
jgi:hypothetical protein